MRKRSPPREVLPRQGVVLPETPRERRELEGLRADVQEHPLAGERLQLRLRNFRGDPDAYLASLGGPLPYMSRLRDIERRTAEHEAGLAARYAELQAETTGPAAFRTAWATVATGMRFDEVNSLIERHNRWYPAESRLPMDPTRGDYALVNGRDYRLPLLDAEWVLARWPTG